MDQSVITTELKGNFEKIGSVGVLVASFLIYSVLYTYSGQFFGFTSAAMAVAKCLPIVFCHLMVWRCGNENLTKPKHQTKLILVGLFASMVGDIFLVYQNQGYFLQGMIAFGIAHINYVFAFGFRPLRPKILLSLLPLGAVVYSYLYPNIKNDVLKYGVLVYIALITLMAWRAMASYNASKSTAEGSTYNENQNDLAAVVGSVLFFISDTVLSLNKFTVPIPHAQYIIMSTYYTAQLFIALSVCGGRVKLD